MTFEQLPASFSVKNHIQDVRLAKRQQLHALFSVSMKTHGVNIKKSSVRAVVLELNSESEVNRTEEWTRSATCANIIRLFGGSGDVRGSLGRIAVLPHASQVVDAILVALGLPLVKIILSVCLSCLACWSSIM